MKSLALSGLAMFLSFVVTSGVMAQVTETPTPSPTETPTPTPAGAPRTGFGY